MHDRNDRERYDYSHSAADRTRAEYGTENKDALLKAIKTALMDRLEAIVQKGAALDLDEVVVDMRETVPINCRLNKDAQTFECEAGIGRLLSLGYCDEQTLADELGVRYSYLSRYGDRTIDKQLRLYCHVLDSDGFQFRNGKEFDPKANGGKGAYTLKPKPHVVLGFTDVDDLAATMFDEDGKPRHDDGPYLYLHISDRHTHNTDPFIAAFTD